MKPTLAIGLLLVSITAARADVLLGVGGSPSSLYAGNTLTLTLDITATSDVPVFFYWFDLLFPASILQVVSVTEEGYFAANGVGFSYDTPFDNTDGLVTNINDAIAGPIGLTGSDTLVQFQFSAIAPGSGQVTVQPDPIDFPAGIVGDGSFDTYTLGSLSAADVSVLASPEPSPLALAAVAACLLAWRRRRAALRD